MGAFPGRALAGHTRPFHHRLARRGRAVLAARVRGLAHGGVLTMPEFILDLGGPDGAAIFDSLDEFAQGYVECLFFTSTGHPGEDLGDVTVAQLAPETVEKIIRDCGSFQRRCKALLTKACSMSEKTFRSAVPYTPKRAGHDFWYTRNGH